MNEFREIAFALLIVYIVFCQFVDSANNEYDPSQYCDLEKNCTADGSVTSRLHIGCPENYNTSKSNFKVLKLKYSDQNFIVNELNQFRSDVALGEIYAKKLTSSTFSYMKKLKWNYELDHLLQLMIKKLSNKKFYCIATKDDPTPIQIVMSFKQPQPLSLEKIFSLAIDELKSKSLQGYSEARRNEIINWSQCYHPETWSFACVAGENNLALNDKEVVVRCAFYGKKLKKSKDDFKFGELCSGCGDIGCSDLFPGLCGSDIANYRAQKGINGRIGYMGIEGLQGREGEKGLKGNRGTVGKEGLKGDKGLPGRRGATGAPGPMTAKGEKGKPGKTANQEDCPGLPGEKGFYGRHGPNGPDGANGEAGDKGEPARQTKGNRGDSGLSIKGEKGDLGRSGDIGLPGSQGDEGPWGDAGDTYTEITVARKVVCTPGMVGSPGLPGPPGKQGPNAESPEFIDIIKSVTTEAYRDIF